jgi:CBS-domain-containing membrane protein
MSFHRTLAALSPRQFPDCTSCLTARRLITCHFITCLPVARQAAHIAGFVTPFPSHRHTHFVSFRSHRRLARRS